MKNNLTILLSFFSLFSICQDSITGRIINYENKKPAFAIIYLIDSSEKTIGYQTSDDFGIFHFDNINNENYKILIVCIGYDTVIINNIYFSQDLNLCDLYIFESGIHWDGWVIKKVFFGLFIKKIRETGGYKEGYLESIVKNGKVELDYFCDQKIVGTYKDNTLNIDFQNTE